MSHTAETLVTFTNAAARGIYTSTALSEFRKIGASRGSEFTLAIDALDRRIAAFENVIIGSLPAGNASADYPYDRASLRREFLEEVWCLLADMNYGMHPAAMVTAAGSKGGSARVMNDHATAGGNLANFDPILMLDGASTYGAQIYLQYGALIDTVFAQGDTLGNNPAGEHQIVTAIAPLATGDRTYDRLAVTTNISTGATATYLLEHTAETAKIVKDSAGGTLLEVPSSAGVKRLRLEPQAGIPAGASDRLVAGGKTFDVHFDGTGFVMAGSPPARAQPITPLVLALPGQEAVFPEAKIAVTHRATVDGVDFLLGRGTDGKTWAMALNSVADVGSAASLPGLEYLLFFNEARIRILRGKLGYNEAVVREIQDDLRQANDALSDLEKQAGLVRGTDEKGALTTETSVETTKLSLFNGRSSTAGGGLLDNSGWSYPSVGDAVHLKAEWQKNRTNIKNYIDRRSAEAQQATLDFQNTLNRFNHAHEVMAKLQDKLTEMLKSPVRNLRK